MFLEKKLGIVNRWPLPSIDECIIYSQFVQEESPTITEFAAYYKIGEPKARRLLEGLRACGFISLSKGRFYSTTFFDHRSDFTDEQLISIIFYFYTQNSIVGSWLVNDIFFNEIKLGKKQKSINTLKTDFLKLRDNEEKKYSYKPLYSELYTYYGEFSGKARHRSPFSSLEMFHAENDILYFRDYQPSADTLYFLFKSAIVHFYKNINNFSVRFILESNISPFRTFLLNTDQSKDYLQDFQKLGYIRIVESADISHIYFEELGDESVFKGHY